MEADVSGTSFVVVELYNIKTQKRGYNMNTFYLDKTKTVCFGI